MKTKLFLTLGLLIGLLNLTNCTKEEVAPSQKETKLTINAFNPTEEHSTKTSISGTSALWTIEDKIGVITNSNAANAEFSSTLSSDNVKASFAGTTSLTAGSNTIYAYYPYSTLYAANECSKTSMKLVLPTTQNPSLSSFDGDADILMGIPYSKTVSADETDVTIDDFRFKRIMAVVKVAFKYSGSMLSSEKVEKVTMVAGSSMLTGGEASAAVLTGGVNMNLQDGTFTMCDCIAGNSRRNYVVAAYQPSSNYTIDASGTNSTYYVVNPITIASGTVLKFDVITSNHKITKNITLSGDMAFVAGAVNTINVTVTDENVSVFNHSLPYEMTTTALNPKANWVSSGWNFVTDGDSENIWGVRIGTGSAVGSAQSLNLTGFTDYVKVSFRALAWKDKTPALFVSLLDEDGAVVKSNFTILSPSITAANTPSVTQEQMEASNALHTMVFSGASTAKNVKFETTSASSDERFFLSYVKVEEASSSDMVHGTVTTADPTNVGGTYATLNGLFAGNDDVITEVGFYWKKTSDHEYTRVSLDKVTYTYKYIDALDYGTSYSYYAFMKVQGSDSEITGTVTEKTFTTTGPTVSLTNPVTLAYNNSSTATLTISSLKDELWTATTSGSGFTLSATSGRTDTDGKSTITVTASGANGSSDIRDLGTITVSLNNYPTSTATTNVKQGTSVVKYYTKVTDISSIIEGGSYLFVTSDTKMMGNTLSSGKFTPVELSTNYDEVNDRIVSNATTDAYAITPNTVTGGFTLKFTGSGKYITYGSSTNFAALSTSAPADNKGYWTISKNGDSDTFIFANVNSSRVILYNSTKIGSYAANNITASGYSCLKVYKLQ